ncbi:ENKD1-like protein [Mya arenaria]|uniref:ENKD1-like protein n=1 Tax=Mya arenaria TaxID=6604 RepID=A0ABY7DLF3_MYAAR|nr:ENKD1-like protein [Mya arenaria]
MSYFISEKSLILNSETGSVCFYGVVYISFTGASTGAKKKLSVMHGLAIQGSGQGFGMPRHLRSDHPKDHFRENVRRMRQMQRQSKERDVQSAQPVKALWKSEKYKDISSKIKSDIEKEPDAPRPHSAHFLRAHMRSGPSVKLQNRPCTPDPQLSVPPASEANDVSSPDASALLLT